MKAITKIQGWPGTGGSGPLPGSIGITDTSSVAALKNYYPKEGGVEFVYAPESNRLVTGVVKRHVHLDGSWHEQLAAALGIGLLLSATNFACGYRCGPVTQSFIIIGRRYESRIDGAYY